MLPSAAKNVPSMTCAAQLAASLAALFRQHPLNSAKAIKELQVSRARTKATRMTGGFMFHALLTLNRLKPHTKKGQRHLSLALNIWWRIGGSNP